MMQWISQNIEAAIGFLTLLGATLGNVLGWIWQFGRLSERFDGLEKAVKNGITSRQNAHEELLKNQAILIARMDERLARVDERCSSREAWIASIAESVKGKQDRQS